MQKPIEIKIDDKKFKEYFKKIAQKVKNMSPLMQEISEEMHDAVEENFEQQGRPKWPKLKPSTLKKREDGQILQDTGALVNSISNNHDSTSAIVGTNKIYAPIHQFGGTIPARIIKPKYKKALFWPGLKHPVKQAKIPATNIPARPFLNLTNSDLKKIAEITKSYLSKI